MNARLVRPGLALLLSAVVATAAAFAPLGARASELRVQPDENRVTASRLAGAWEPEPALNERLGSARRIERIEFAPDESVLAGIPDELTSHVANERVWQAGTLSVFSKGEESREPYVLVTWTGNSLAVQYRSRGGEELDDGEGCILTVVPARDPAQDLLFVGGDNGCARSSSAKRSRTRAAGSARSRARRVAAR